MLDTGCSVSEFTGQGLDLTRVETPCHVLDRAMLRRNLAILRSVRERTGCRILMALKAFAFYHVFPDIARSLSGAATSSLNEARLAHEFFPGERHVFAPAYTSREMDKLLPIVDHVVFNSFPQWRRFRSRIQAADHEIHCGMRINPCHSEVATPMYDPCAPRSRLGVTPEQFERGALDGISGLHFHTLCELGSDALERTLAAVNEHFGDVYGKLRWINFGGGHHITRADYDVERLCRMILEFSRQTGLQVYLEPGEAVVLNAGIFVASVLDITENGGPIAILDASAAAHMPDVLEMPYRPSIVGAGLPGRYPYTYRLGGLTCLAGDVIGNYSFPEPLVVGQKIVFLDMAHYSVVKSTLFNGVNAPSLATFDSDHGTYQVVRTFGYEDYRARMG